MWSTGHACDAARDIPESSNAEPLRQDGTAGLARPSGNEFPQMFVVAFASQKGGSGKTTLSGQLAVQAHLAGAGPVALVDTDPQGSLADWWNERQDTNPMFVRTHISRLEADLDRLAANGIRLVMVDTPPAVTSMIQKVINVADLVVVPTRPSPHDLRAVGATVDLVERAEKAMVFVVNAGTRRAKITAEAAVALSQHGTVAPVTIHNRTDFARSMIDGRTVMELDPKSKSAEEIKHLWSYLAPRIGRRPAVMPLNLERTVEPLELVQQAPASSTTSTKAPAAPLPFSPRQPAAETRKRAGCFGRRSQAI